MFESADIPEEIVYNSYVIRLKQEPANDGFYLYAFVYTQNDIQLARQQNENKNIRMRCLVTNQSPRSKDKIVIQDFINKVKSEIDLYKDNIKENDWHCDELM